MREASFDSDACKVLVILGASGTGKSTVAESLSRRLGRTWLQCDDLRLMLQFSGLLRQEAEDCLNIFLAPDAWKLSTSDLVDGLIRVTELLEPALRVIIHSHVVTDAPMILEGDGIHPRLAIGDVLRPLVDDGTIRFCCLSTPPKDVLLANMVARNRGMDGLGDEERAAQATVYSAFGAWLEHESGKAHIPIVPSLPHESLADRVLAAATPQGR